LLAPIRTRREALARDPGYVLGVLQQGTASALQKTGATLNEIRDALGLFKLDRRVRAIKPAEQ